MEEPSSSARLYSMKIEPIKRKVVHSSCKENDLQTAAIPDEDSPDGSSKAKRKKKRFYCTICGKYLLNIEEHRRMHLNIRTQQCPYCEKAFVHRSNLHAHLNIHTQEHVYRCERCDSEFSSIQGLKQHRTTHFERQYACTVCNRNYSRKFYLRIHMQRMHMPQVQKHKCLICDREFLSETLMEEHMKVHQDSTLHACSECFRVYNAKRNLLRHIRIAHPQPQSQKG